MEKLTEEQRIIVEMFQKNFDGLTYAQQVVLNRVLQKTADADFQDNYYGTDYNDCHGDYYDAE